MINKNGLNKIIPTKSLLTKEISSFHSNKIPFLKYLSKYLHNIMVDFDNLYMLHSQQLNQHTQYQQHPQLKLQLLYRSPKTL